jgi:hypothetical protein
LGDGFFNCSERFCRDSLDLVGSAEVLLWKIFQTEAASLTMSLRRISVVSGIGKARVKFFSPSILILNQIKNVGLTDKSLVNIYSYLNQLAILPINYDIEYIFIQPFFGERSD